ncbi:MAG: prolyl-tRNA synthetase associated domain-containing protein, partial [Oribacterium parvum]|nr:prolyl-tRNA synthetase associated domain-containing protein [Oribacterium parvum]
MALTVEKGRPEKSEGRSKKELAVYDYLDKLG